MHEVLPGCTRCCRRLMIHVAGLFPSGIRELTGRLRTRRQRNVKDEHRKGRGGEKPDAGSCGSSSAPHNPAFVIRHHRSPFTRPLGRLPKTIMLRDPYGPHKGTNRMMRPELYSYIHLKGERH